MNIPSAFGSICLAGAATMLLVLVGYVYLEWRR